VDIEDDVLQAAKEMAAAEGTTAGKVLSALARRGLHSRLDPKSRKGSTRGGVPLLPSRGEVVTLKQVQDLMDSEGV
jgi:hypothetical protein